VRCELEDGTLSVGTGRDDTDYTVSAKFHFRKWSHVSRLSVSNCASKRTVGRVVNGDDDARGKDNLLPGLANVQDVDTVGPGLPQVWLHVNLEVLAAEMALSSQEHLNVLLGGVEDGGEVGRSHFDGLALYKLVGIEKLSCCVRGNFWWRDLDDANIVWERLVPNGLRVTALPASAKPVAGHGSAKDSRVVAASV